MEVDPQTWIIQERSYMKAYQRISVLFVDNLITLRRLQQQQARPMQVLQRTLKEREIGRHCYLAEEALSGPELLSLKEALHLDDAEWKMYKAKAISPPGDWKREEYMSRH